MTTARKAPKPKALSVLVTPASASDWRAWLHAHHTQHDGIRLRLFKKDSGRQVLTYAQALDEALCYGWIDGRKNTHDDLSWIQHFSPRRPRSVWSKINRGHVERLLREGRMMPAGTAQVDAAKRDGRWDRAYDAQGQSAVPLDFLAALKRLPKAAAFFATLNKTNRYAISYRLQTAKKPETRARRMQAILAMLQREETFY